jgi:2-amino-4-hydroxy-6-hydroxymethyldihydropteridine diphosphokinase
MACIYLGIGSNSSDKGVKINEALKLLEEKIGIIVAKSHIYETEPWGFECNDNFLNMAVEINTNLTPEEILLSCKNIEKSLGREKSTKNKYDSRTIDLDILFYKNEIIKTSAMVIPHASIEKRLFVLLPLNDIAPHYVHPVLKENITTLLQKCTDTCWIKRIL